MAMKIGDIGVVGVEAIYMASCCVVVATLLCEVYWIMDYFESVVLYEACPFLVIRIRWNCSVIIGSSL